MLKIGKLSSIYSRLLSSRAEIARNSRRSVQDTSYLRAKGVNACFRQVCPFAGECVHSYERLVILIDVGRGTDGPDQLLDWRDSSASQKLF